MPRIPFPFRSRSRRGIVIGAGGTLGMAWTIGALSALQETTGWDPRSAELIVGTSQGSVLAAMLAAGVSPRDLLAWQRGELPVNHSLHRRSGQRGSGRTGGDTDAGGRAGGRTGALPPLPLPVPASPRLALRGLRHPRQVPVMSALVGLLPRGRSTMITPDTLLDGLVAPGAWVAHPATWVVAMDYVTGERVAFGSPGAPTVGMHDAIRASCAIPAWYPPVRIGGRLYVDGGAASPTSLDLVAGAGLDEVVVLAPLASAVSARPRSLSEATERLMRRTMSRRLAAEVAAVTRAGTRVLRLDPGPEDLAVMGANLMDPRRRRHVLETSLRTSRAALERDTAAG